MLQYKPVIETVVILRLSLCVEISKKKEAQAGIQ